MRVVIPVEPSGFHAEIFEFSGCFAQGETVQEAYTNLERAADAWIEACLLRGQSVPEPSTSVTYSGRIVLRLPRGMHRKAAAFAEKDDTSLNTFLVSAVSARVGAEDFCDVLTQRLEQRVVDVVLMASRAWVEHWSSESATTKNIEKRKLQIEERAGTDSSTTTTYSKVLHNA